jgi:hypothetical protein
MIFKIFLVLIIAYIFFRSIVPFIIFPGYLFSPKIKRTSSLQKIAKRLQGKTKEQTLKNVFEYVVKKHFGIAGTIKKVTLLKNAFLNNPEKLLFKKIPLYCHNSNLLLKTILVNTNKIIEKDINVKWAFGTDTGIHQYLIVKSGKKSFKLDPFYNVFELLDS